MRKKLIVIMIVLAMVLVAACGGTNNDQAEEKESEAKEESEANTSEEYIEVEAAGIKIKAPESYVNNQDKTFIYTHGQKAVEGLYYGLLYLYPDNYSNLMSMSDEDFYAAEKNSINLLTVLKAKDISEEKLKTWYAAVSLEDDFQLESLGKADGYDIYIIRDGEVPEALSPELKTVFESIIKEIDETKDNIEHFQPVEEEEKTAEGTISFKTTTVDGEEISSEDIFSKNEITVLNLWASWCGPCVGEMPELEELHKELQEKGCGVVGILVDANEGSGLKDGQEIIADTGVTYINLIPWEGLNETISFKYLPTTIFVDSNGQIVGDPVIGANVPGYRWAIEDLIG